MSNADFDFYLRLNPDVFPFVAHETWLVSGAAYRGRYLDPAGVARRRVQLFHPTDESRRDMLYADQLEPEVYAWVSPPERTLPSDAVRTGATAVSEGAAGVWQDEGGR